MEDQELGTCLQGSDSADGILVRTLACSHEAQEGRPAVLTSDTCHGPQQVQTVAWQVGHFHICALGPKPDVGAFAHMVRLFLCPSLTLTQNQVPSQLLRGGCSHGGARGGG